MATNEQPSISSPPTLRLLDGALGLAELAGVLRTFWWKILVASTGVGVAALLLMLTQPNYYRTRAVITATGEEKAPLGALGALASFGIQLGGPSKIEDLELLLRSNDLTVRVFTKYDLWAEILGNRFDPKSRAIVPTIRERLFRSRAPAPVGDWDAIRIAELNLKTAINKKNSTLTITFDSLSADGSARIVEDYLQEAKSRLQEEALDRSRKNKKFLEEQIARTDDALSRDRLFSILSQEIEKEMMALNREQFGFKTIDAPRVPDRKAGPPRTLIAGGAALTSLVVLLAFFVLRERYRTRAVVHPT